MAEATINESCIIGLPTCGYAFSSSRMAFLAAPSDDEFQVELELLQALLREKDYEAYVAVQKIEPAKFAFCTKICSKIITSQFCIVLLNASTHRDHQTVRIPNPNVHLEYGLMLAFKKHILPFQREGDALAFNIRPLDTILYTNSTLKEKADQAIDAAILATGTTHRATPALASSENLLRYLAVRGLRLSDVSARAMASLFRLSTPLGFSLLDGRDGVVYFGVFTQEPAREVVFRLKLLLQSVHQAIEQFEHMGKASLTAEQIRGWEHLWGRLQVEVLVSKDLDRPRVEARVRELTIGFRAIPWSLLTADDIDARIQAEYGAIGNL